MSGQADWRLELNRRIVPIINDDFQKKIIAICRY